MMNQMTFRNVIHDLFAEKARVFLTILAIAWGTFSITLMLSVGEGLRISFGHAMRNAGKNVLIINPGVTTQSYQGRPVNQKIQLTPQDYTLLQRSFSETATLTPVYTVYASLAHHKKTAWSSNTAVYPRFGNIHNVKLQPGGRFINPLDIQQHRRVIVIGKQVANDLFASKSAMNQMVSFSGQPFRVIGVTAIKAQVYGVPDKYRTWIPASTYLNLSQVQRIDQILLQTKTRMNIDKLKQQIRQLIAFNHHASPDDRGILSIQDLGEMQRNTDLFFTRMEIFLGIVGLFTLIVAAVGIANVMYASVSRATMEIGLKKALGAPDRVILKHYIYQALAAATLGGLTGLIFSYGLISLIRLIPIHSEMYQMIGQPKPVLSLMIISVTVLLLGLVALIAGYFPARHATQVDPVIALRKE